MAKLLLATNNRGKVEEYRSLLGGLGYELVSLAEAGVTAELVEAGHSFRENAILKAVQAARSSGLLSLADDSGLEVDALHGAPGVYSARYGGPGLTDRERYERLLAEMEGVPWGSRQARFRAVIALCWPSGRVAWCEGRREGVVGREPRGQHGFGYDPVLYLPDWGYTVAELPPPVKNAISHRAQAARCVRQILARLEAET